MSNTQIEKIIKSNTLVRTIGEGYEVEWFDSDNALKELEDYINKAIQQAYKSGYIQASIEYTKDEIVMEGNNG